MFQVGISPYVYELKAKVARQLEISPQRTGRYRTPTAGHSPVIAYFVRLIDLIFFGLRRGRCHALSSNSPSLIGGAARLLFVCSNQCPRPLRLDLSGPLSSERQWKPETEWRIVGWQMTAHGAWSMQTLVTARWLDRQYLQWREKIQAVVHKLLVFFFFANTIIGNQLTCHRCEQLVIYCIHVL